MTSDELLDPSCPLVYCDLHACGWSGEADDNCYYATDIENLGLQSFAGAVRIFDYDINEDGVAEIIGHLGYVERWQGPSKPYYRVRPIAGSWFHIPHEADLPARYQEWKAARMTQRVDGAAEPSS